jgi:acyl dehydratase
MEHALTPGQALASLVLPPLDRATLALFAGASGDHHPIHIDIDHARRAGVPDVFGHGMLGMAWLARALTAEVPQRRLRAFEARFTGILQLGDRLTCTARVVEHTRHAGEPCARLELTATSARGDTLIAGSALVSLNSPES